jgi:Carbohydrate-selective porin, OprB family/short chain dehydrogenase/S-layer homology domain
VWKTETTDTNRKIEQIFTRMGKTGAGAAIYNSLNTQWWHGGKALKDILNKPVPPLQSQYKRRQKMQIEGAVALVTGANGGIGKYYVEALQAAGAARIYAGARNPSSLNEMAATDPQRIIPIQLDIIDEQSVSDAAAKCQDVNLLINNAGIGLLKGFISAPDLKSARAEIEVNYFGTLAFLFQRAAIAKTMLQLSQLFSSTFSLLFLIAQTSTVLAQSATNNIVDQVTSVSQLEDIQPTDWAFQALQSLVERYGVIEGYPDNSFRGNRAITRYEFAAGLNAALNRINELIATGTENIIAREDLLTLQRLREEFAAELATLRSRVDALEARTAELETNQFSTTTKLTGQAIFAVNAGRMSSDRIIAPRGAVITSDDPNPTVIYRASLDLNTSFSGTDLLKVRLVTGSDGITDNAAGFLEPNLGSTLDFSIPGRDGRFSLARFYYTFTPIKDLKVTVGPALVAPDFVDKNRYANTSFLDFSTLALVNNFILLPRPGGAGIVIDWNPGGGAVKLRGLYVSGDAADRLPENERFIGGGAPENIRLFPTAGGGAKGGFFGDPYQGFVELEYAASKDFSIRLQYSGGEIFGSSFNGFGVNFDWALNQKLGIFGRYGYATYPDTSLGDISPNYWSAGIGFRDLFVAKAIAGIAIGQPFIESAVGNVTQTNFEAFYNFPFSDRLRVTPLIQVITNPGNQDANGTIITGTLRTVFSF